MCLELVWNHSVRGVFDAASEVPLTSGRLISGPRRATVAPSIEPRPKVRVPRCRCSCVRRFFDRAIQSPGAGRRPPFGDSQGPSQQTQFNSGRNRFSETASGEEHARAAVSVRDLDEPPVAPSSGVNRNREPILPVLASDPILPVLGHFLDQEHQQFLVASASAAQQSTKLAKRTCVSASAPPACG